MSLNLACLIRNLPAVLRSWYAGSRRLVIVARIVKGTVSKVEIATELPQDKVHLLLAGDYRLYERIFRGESSLATSFISGRLRVEPVHDFPAWPKLAAKSLVTGNLLLKIVRKVPTVFAGQV